MPCSAIIYKLSAFSKVASLFVLQMKISFFIVYSNRKDMYAVPLTRPAVKMQLPARVAAACSHQQTPTS